MSINLYIDLLNNVLASDGYSKTDYATANHYYFAGYTPVAAAAAIITVRVGRAAA